MIPVTSFPILTFEQANPGLARMNYMSKLASNVMQDVQQGMYLSKYPQTLDEQLKQMRAATTLSQAQAAIAPQMEQAKLATQQAMPNLYNAQAGLYGSEATKNYAEIPKLKAEGLQAQFYAQNPLLAGTGMTQQVGALQYLMQHPELNGQPQGANQPSAPMGNVTQTAIPSPAIYGQPSTLGDLMTLGQGGVPGMTLAPQAAYPAAAPQAAPALPMQQMGGQPNQPATLADMVRQGIFSQQQSQMARSNYYNAQVNSMNWRTMPQDFRTQMLAQAAGMGIDPNDAQKEFMNGKTIEQMALERGFDPHNLPTPIQPLTKTSISRMQNRQSALAELANIEQPVKDALSPYAQRFAGWSPQQILDQVKNDDPDKVARYVAAVAVLPEISAIRYRAMQGQQLGIEAMREITNKTYGDFKTMQPLITPAVFNKAQGYIDSWIQNAGKVANDSITNMYQQMEEATPNGQNNQAAPQTLGQAMAPQQAATIPNLTQENLEYTAKKKGISVDEVKRRLGVK